MGKKVLLVDDSIVRGTTSMELVQMAREAGAVKVRSREAGDFVDHPLRAIYAYKLPAIFAPKLVRTLSFGRAVGVSHMLIVILIY